MSTLTLSHEADIVAQAARYYRSMFRGREESWNLRDKHMTETLAALIGHFDSGRSKVIVWAHKSHLGDARATEMSARGECNVGQLTRERFISTIEGLACIRGGEGSKFLSVISSRRTFPRTEPVNPLEVEAGRPRAS